MDTSRMQQQFVVISDAGVTSQPSTLGAGLLNFSAPAIHSILIPRRLDWCLSNPRGEPPASYRLLQLGLIGTGLAYAVLGPSGDAVRAGMAAPNALMRLASVCTGCAFIMLLLPLEDGRKQSQRNRNSFVQQPAMGGYGFRGRKFS